MEQKQKFEIVNARFLKEHSIMFYIECPQNMWGRGKFCSA